MLGARTGSLAVLLLLTAVRADILEPPRGAAPGLRVSRMSGRVEVKLDKRDGASSPRLPYLRSGSVIRVLSGRAAFDSDLHATVRAAEGDAFRFIAIRPEGSRAATLRIAAVEREPKGLEISVGDYKFRLRKGGALSITAAWPGEVVVKSDARGVEFAPGSASPEGRILDTGRRLDSGQAVTVAVPEAPGYENTPVDPSSLAVERAGDAEFVVSAPRAEERALLVRDEEARRIIADWPVVSLRTAEVVMEKYGPPDLALNDRLSWFDSGPWRITTVHRDPRAHLDVLEQTIGYSVPEDKREDLARLDVNLRLSRDNRELSASSEAEETNFLALNLADEVVRDLKTPAEARAAYLKTVVQWNAGKTSPYMKRLLFR